MDLNVDFDAPCSAPDLFRWVDDLVRYPAWMPLVHRAEVEVDTPAVWIVELRARVGPLSRSKRLRMVRTVSDGPHRARFERDEADGRRHAAWVLDAQVTATSGGSSTGSRLTMQLHYGGALWTGGLLERVLTDQIEQGKDKLLALIADADADSGAAAGVAPTDADGATTDPA